MPARILPSFSRAEVASHNSKKSCYVTIGTNVYDVTDFLDAHPGGAEYILEWAGKDIAEILKDESSHHHSEAAYEVLDDSLVGFVLSEKPAATNGAAAKQNGSANPASAADEKSALGTATAPPPGIGGDYALAIRGSELPDMVRVVDAKGEEKWVHPRTGMADEADLNKETDSARDYKTHKFLDLERPLFAQIWTGGFSKAFYLDQVHRPRHYKGGASAPLFGNFLEPLTLTPWWVVPTIWLPPVAYGTYLAVQGLDSPVVAASYWLFGLFLWTLVEYTLHRFLFHLDYYLPDNRVGITLHFTLHGIHHYLPMDKYRLVMPPTLFIALATPFWKLAHAIFHWNWYVATAVFCGGIFGYICYDLTHYFLHHQNLPLWYKQLKKYHLQHHFLDYENGFGVTSRFWDRIFGTELVDPVKKT